MTSQSLWWEAILCHSNIPTVPDKCLLALVSKLHRAPAASEGFLVFAGHRYLVILEVKPLVAAEDDNYWIRTIPADGCGIENCVNKATLLNNTETIRYKENNMDPTSTPDPKISTMCSDEPYGFLAPMLGWKVGEPSNVDGKHSKR